MKIKIVKIKKANAKGYTHINESDYDAEKHELFIAHEKPKEGVSASSTSQSSQPNKNQRSNNKGR